MINKIRMNEDLLSLIIMVQNYKNFIDSQENENTKKNKIAHIKSILTFVISQNINDAVNKISEELLIYLIPSEYIGLFKATLMKNNILYKIA